MLTHAQPINLRPTPASTGHLYKSFETYYPNNMASSDNHILEPFNITTPPQHSYTPMGSVLDSVMKLNWAQECVKHLKTLSKYYLLLLDTRLLP